LYPFYDELDPTLPSLEEYTRKGMLMITTHPTRLLLGDFDDERPSPG